MHKKGTKYKTQYLDISANFKISIAANLTTEMDNCHVGGTENKSGCKERHCYTVYEPNVCIKCQFS